MKKLIIATVFVNNELDPYNGTRNNQWLALMKKFIRANTPQEYDIISWCNSCEIKDNEIKVIGTSKNEWKNIEIGDKTTKISSHIVALENILNYFKQNDYENYLILDSDCFPVKYNWLNILSSINHDFASIIRCENLDTFPHPSAFFIRGKDNIDKITFRPEWIRNLCGEMIADAGTKIPNHLVFPLIRTNVWNPHPIFSGIYYDMFYHHCCGSTLKKTRATEFNYYKNVISVGDELWHKEIEGWLYNQLVNDPHKFIGKLRGINDII